MDDRRRRELETSISDLESTIRANLSQISRNQDMLQYAERGSDHARRLEKESENLKVDNKHNQQRISEIKREIQRG